MGVSVAEQAVLDRIDEEALVALTTALVRAGQNPPGEEAATVNVLRVAAVELGLDVVESAVEPGRNNVARHVAGRHRTRPAAARPHRRRPGRRGVDDGPVRRCGAATAASTAAAPPT